jgi:hypothetical protein
MRRCAICIPCMELPLLPKRARFLSEPPPNLALTLHLCHPQNQLHGLLPPIQIATSIGKAASKT